MRNHPVVADFASRKEALISVILGYTPNQKKRDDFLLWVEEDLDQNGTQQQIITTLASCLADGLLYGNWPWVLNR